MLRGAAGDAWLQLSLCPAEDAGSSRRSCLLPLGRPPSPCLLLPASLSTSPSPLLCPLCCPQAAFEMRERLAAMLGEEAAKELFAGTFHR